MNKDISTNETLNVGQTNFKALPDMLDNIVLQVKKEPETKETTNLLTKVQEAKDAILWWFKSHGQQMAS